jgi:hypothetical protein
MIVSAYKLSIIQLAGQSTISFSRTLNLPAVKSITLFTFVLLLKNNDVAVTHFSLYPSESA